MHIVEDDEPTRSLLEDLCSSAGYRSHAYASARELLASPEELNGCLLTDVRMPEIDGIDLLRRLRSDGELIPAIVITAHGDFRMAAKAIKIGANDFIEKPFQNGRLINLIAEALASTPEETVTVARSVARRLRTLTPREREVCDLLLGGSRTKVLAQRLGISVRTAELHRRRVLAKMGVRSLVDLVRLAPVVDMIHAAEERAALPL